MNRYISKRPSGIWETSAQTIELDNLKLDPQNVRFRHLPSVPGQREIEKLIWEEFDTRELLKQVIASGGLTTPPIVSADFVVKEGNRRIVCCRKARDMARDGKIPGMAAGSFDTVQCEVLPGNVDSVDVKLFLAREHVTGKKEWDALNQAALIYELYNELGKSYDDIRDSLGIGKGEVINKTKAYDATVAFMQKFPKAADVRKFVYFSELFKRRATAQWAESSAANMERFCKWLAADSPKFTDSRQMRRLGEVLENSEALQALQGAKGNMEIAIRVLDSRRGGDSQVFRALAKASDLLDHIPRTEYLAISRDKAKANLLHELREKIQVIFDELRIKYD